MTEAASIVIGGGLAGSAFAIELARQRRPVIIFERTMGQHHKVCGEFLSAEARDLLARAEIDVWKLGARPESQLGLEFAGHGLGLPRCPLWARSCLLHRSKRYSITSSAATRRPGGTVRPSAFAVLRLMVVSYFVGVCTGRSEGFAPRITRST
jgi:2-polyprenyl-6-methoxyphenol hydroxylase-like FAD-dependent oxidoreductase